MPILSIYCVFANYEEASRIGRTVVEERLAACINILAPCHSIYRWQGKLEEAEEVPAILKTGTDRVDELIARLAELHSYDVPAIVCWPAQRMFSAYGEWVQNETAPT
ncbi:MAG TPA: divalent-cation tolerance protein CutA [Sphingomicrobium sp.]|nr:divalent-cation tolerance protein CutA [Sphingomicrobium sp.]